MGFGGLVLSAFALTTLDTATRLCRFLFVELSEKEEGKPATIVTFVTNRYVAGILVVVAAGAFALTGTAMQIWPIFGSANQLLAGLALLAGAIWLARMGKGNKFVLYPMVFMFAVTLTALVFMFLKTLAAATWPLVIVSAVLFILGIVLLYLSVSRLIAVGKEKTAAS